MYHFPQIVYCVDWLALFPSFLSFFFLVSLFLSLFFCSFLPSFFETMSHSVAYVRLDLTA